MVSEDWSSILDLPEPWPTPAELSGPSQIPMTNLVIRMLETDLLGNDVIEAVGRLITEHAGFNTWVGTHGKRELTLQQLADYSHMAGECVRRVYEPWKELMARNEVTQRLAGHDLAERHRLRTALDEVISTLRTSRRPPDA